MPSTPAHLSATDVSALGRMLEDADACVERLLVLLGEERTALSTGEPADIDESVRRKVECVAELERLDTERVRMCRALSVPNDDIDAFLRTHDPAYRSETWQRFVNNLERCREENAINGNLTRVRREHIEKALMILRAGVQNAPTLYGPDGLEKSQEATSLGQA